MTRILIIAAIAPITALPVAGQPAKATNDKEMRMLGKTRAQVQRQFNHRVGADTGREYRQTNRGTVHLGVYYNKLNGKVEAVSYANTDRDHPFSDELMERLVRANLPKADWKSASRCLPLYLFPNKFPDIDTYTVDAPGGNVYYVEIGKDLEHSASGTPDGDTYVLITNAALATSLAHKSIHR